MRTAKAICSEICRARCCSWSFIELTLEEAARLRALAKRKRLPQPELAPYTARDGSDGFIMHATPCVFLNKANLCGIYKDRPEHCRAFPDTVRDWCPLSRVLFPELLPGHLRPLPLDPEPQRARRPRRRLTTVAASDPDA